MMPQLYLVDLDDGRLKHQKRRVDRGRRVGILLSLCVLLQRTYSAEDINKAHTRTLMG